MLEQPSAVAKRRCSGKSKNLRFLVGYGAKSHAVFRQPSAVAKRQRSGRCRELSSLLGFGAKPQNNVPQSPRPAVFPNRPLDDFPALRYDNRVKEVKKRVLPHRIARIAKTVWGDARESGDRAQGAAGGGIYRRDWGYGKKDGKRAGCLQIDCA